MAEQGLPPLEPALRALLDRERARTQVKGGAKEAAYARITAKLAMGALVDAGTKNVVAPRTVAALGGKSVPALLLAFAVGGAAGSVITGAVLRSPHAATPDASSRQTSPVPVAMDMPPPPRPVMAGEPQPVAESAAPSPESRPTVTHRPGSTSAAEPTPAVDRSLADERRILDRAQMALIRGDAQAAIAAAEEHRTHFPSGQLEVEREALLIQALVLAHRDDDARARAARFRARYPNSVFRRVVELATGSEEK